MHNYLQLDHNHLWTGLFSSDAFNMTITILSDEIKVMYYKPKFEYLWAQVADDCPIIMALSNLYHDQSRHELYLPRHEKNHKIGNKIMKAHKVKALV
jgi:hypothetical protein